MTPLIPHINEDEWTCEGGCRRKSVNISKETMVWRCYKDKRWGQGGACDYDVCADCIEMYKVKTLNS